MILAGHSGAGPLLPAIRQATGRAIAGYLFVDAGHFHMLVDAPAVAGAMLELIGELLRA